MAELTLAIIPIGLKVCSALTSYLGALKDRDDALVRLTRQAESLENCFRLLDASLKQGHLDPARYRTVPHIIVCLKNCEEGLKDLEEFEQSQKSQNRLEHGLQKLRFPLRKAHLEDLENTLDRLCQPLSLAIQSLQLEIDLANSSALSHNVTKVQQATDVVSDVQTAVGNLTVPINTIRSRLPLLQDSVDGLIPQIIPQINLVIESQLQVHMENIRQSLKDTGLTATRRHNATNEILSQLTTLNSGRVDVVAKLASKPSAIAELGSYISTCSCLVRKSSTAQTYHLGSFLFTDNIVTKESHIEGCPFYVADFKSSRRRTLSIAGIIKSLNCAIQLTFCTKTGAGGFAINPSLMHFGVVDKHTAPAFQVLDLLSQCPVYKPQEAEHCLCLEAVLRKLQEVFASGRARPTDIDQDGESLLHMLSYATNREFPTVLGRIAPSPELEALFGFLVAIGTPVHFASSTGMLALHTAASNFAISASVLRKLCFEDADIHTPGQFLFSTKDGFFFEMIAENDRESKEVTEALYGPLTQAIIRYDEEGIRELIEKSPESLQETNIYGTTALCLAMEKPEILKLIMSTAKPIAWNIVLGWIFLPLRRAMEMSGPICNSQDDDAGSRCPCVVAANILLDANCPILPAKDFQRGFPEENMFASASDHCKALIAQTLRSRRRDLRDLARERLLKHECSLVDSEAGELDFYAIEVDRMLYRKHFTSFDRISTVIHDDISHLSREVPIYRPLYLSLESPEDASIFFDLGFWDIDHLPVSTEPDDDSLYLIKNFLLHSTPQYATWLHTNLPRLWEWTSQYSILEGFDFILANITGRYFACYCFTNIDKALEGLAFTMDILDSEATEQCSCPCAAGGRNPFDMIARQLTHEQRRIKSPMLEIGLVLKFYGESLQLNQLICLVRQATFEALEMTHTCVGTSSGSSLYTSMQTEDENLQEDIEDSEDDVEKVGYLNGLVAEFEDFVLGRSESLEHTPGPSDGDHAVIHERALMFWYGIWPDKVEEIKKRLEATWDPDVEILNELGVSLWLEEEEDVASETLEEYRTRRFYEFMAKLDKI
ncbi:uncharacterized protein FIESC28_00160 [Fusarium coffeatum]|uniref:Fungal N-terminal domain-containing protein n=1 Tax=Fusarium coffeatum TaxID=231269 RepID=A0A366SDU9_9HYPO|nr:uncharacterized protein FIESC28_00160 [Fusarium coffeatum]RBR27088.1 hypothetical protein FIESC28_00160 [Fusarium coffeatum]